MKVVIVCLTIIFFITGCSFNPIDSSSIPLGNSIGAFQYNENIPDKPIIENGVFYTNGLCISFETPSDYGLDSSSTNDILLYTKEGSYSFAISVCTIDNVDVSAYESNFKDKILELYPDGSFSFHGDSQSIIVNNLTWESYSCRINDKDLMGYFTFYDNKLVLLEFSGSSNDAFKENLRDSILIEKEIENDK